MGWSATRSACWTMDEMSKVCIAQTGSSNRFEARGTAYFFETSRRSMDDGHISGAIYRMLDDGLCRRSGSFYIEPDGTIRRMPSALRKPIEANLHPCPTCEGLGEVTHHVPDPDGVFDLTQACGSCGGSGKVTAGALEEIACL